jgi:hypothetical protein
VKQVLGWNGSLERENQKKGNYPPKKVKLERYLVSTFRSVNGNIREEVLQQNLSGPGYQETICGRERNFPTWCVLTHTR